MVNKGPLRTQGFLQGRGVGRSDLDDKMDFEILNLSFTPAGLEGTYILMVGVALPR